MNLIADENVDSALVGRLRSDGHQVYYIAESEPGVTDEVVLQRASGLSALLLTEDKDFGELVFRQHLAHSGVILIRMDDASPLLMGEVVSAALARHETELITNFTVISSGQVRIRKAP